MQSFAVEAIRRAVLVVGQGRIEVDRMEDAVAVSVYDATSALHAAFVVKNGVPMGYKPEEMAHENVLEVLRHMVDDQPVRIPFDGTGLELVAFKLDDTLDVFIRKAEGEEPIHGETVPLSAFHS